APVIYCRKRLLVCYYRRHYKHTLLHPCQEGRSRIDVLGEIPPAAENHRIEFHLNLLFIFLGESNNPVYRTDPREVIEAQMGEPNMLAADLHAFRWSQYS